MYIYKIEKGVLPELPATDVQWLQQVFMQSGKPSQALFARLEAVHITVTT